MSFFSKLNESLNDFLIGSNFQVSEARNETIETHNNMLVKNYKSATPGKNGQSHYQVTEKSRIRKEVDHVVSVAKNRLHESVLTAMYSVIMR